MRVVVISGFFNPLHIGHIDYISAARNLGDFLIVIVNSDEQVETKGSIPFMNEDDRLNIITNIKGVDRAVLAIDKDSSVCQTIREEFKRLQNDPFFEEMIFANGGDRKQGGVPEDILEEELGVRMFYNTGGDKVQSSSELIKKTEFFLKTE
jgi:cytidyltransferase-like protein|tara:strand:+ start:142 stop:594 length:453 start_codon:yes stop_codon:yes gene_type:complete